MPKLTHKRKVTKRIWLAFDLGLVGDYDGLYTWLANHEAQECGDGIATFKYTLDGSGQSIDDVLKQDLESSVEFGKRARVYLIWHDDTGQHGKFLIGNRKRAAPWSAYGIADTGTDND